MNLIRSLLQSLLRWVPFVLLTIAIGRTGGWIPAASFAGITLTVRRHWFLASVAAGLLVWFLHVRYSIVIGGAAYRLLWAVSVDAVFRVLNNRGIKPDPIVPKLRCKHGLSERIRQADRLLRHQLGGAALDAYLVVLADHPTGDACERRLYLRTAEAAVLAGNARLALELAEAALGDVPGEPVGRTATIVVRAHATRAQARILLGDRRGATGALQEARRITQAEKFTDRYVRWTAVDTVIASQTIDSPNDIVTDMAGAIHRQELPLREDERFARRLVRAGWRALDAGFPDASIKCGDSAIEAVDHNSWFVEAMLDSGKRVRIPLHRALQWRVYADAVVMQVAAVAQGGNEGNAPGERAIRRAAAALQRFDDPWTAARLAFERATIATRAGAADTAMELLGQAYALADYRMHTFCDPERLADWTAGRTLVVRALTALTGAPPPAVVEPWPSTLDDLQRRQFAGQASLAVFTRLRERDPRAFGAAHDRVVAALGRPPEPLPPGPGVDDAFHGRSQTAVAAEPPTVAVPAIPTQPAATDVSDRATPDAAPVEPLPGWLHDVLLDGPGERCWTLCLALLCARDMGHGHVGPEHVLLASLGERPIARLIEDFGVPVADLRAAVAARFRVTAAPPELDPRVLRLVGLAAAEAARWGERRVRAPFLVLAMLRDQSSAATAMLEAHGVERREALVRLLAATVHRTELPLTPLFDVDAFVGPNRLTVPARLVLATALDLAAAESGLLGPGHVRQALAVADWSAASPRIAIGDDALHAGVRLTRGARHMLRSAQDTAEQYGHPGVGVEQLRAAANPEAANGHGLDPAARATVRSAYQRARSEGRPYMSPSDLRWALLHGSVDSDWFAEVPPPVPTPQVEQMLSTAAGTADGPVDLDHLRATILGDQFARATR